MMREKLKAPRTGENVAENHLSRSLEMTIIEVIYISWYGFVILINMILPKLSVYSVFNCQELYDSYLERCYLKFIIIKSRVFLLVC